MTEEMLILAVDYNYLKAHRVGWPKRFHVVAQCLTLGQIEPQPAEFANLVYQFQVDHPELGKPDGKLGPKTFRAMVEAQKGSLGSNDSPVPAPAWISDSAFAPKPPAGSGPRWLQYALSEMHEWSRQTGMMKRRKAKKAERYMTRDEQYFAASPFFGNGVKPRGRLPVNKLRYDWCAAFVNWCLHVSGHSHTGSAGANSFIVPTWWHFEASPTPKKGCVIVVGNGSRGRHVGFLWSSKNLPDDPDGDVKMTRGRRLELLGGNQSQRITIMNESRKLLACRDNEGNLSPYLWPKVGTPTCNHDPNSEGGHFCGKVHTE